MSLAFGWGAGLAMAVWISGGGHINPAVSQSTHFTRWNMSSQDLTLSQVTLAMAVFRGFSWRRVPVFWLCQLLGALVGAAIVYGNYVRAIDIFEGGRHIRTLATAGIFGTVPVCTRSLQSPNSLILGLEASLRDERRVFLLRAHCHCPSRHGRLCAH